MLLIPRNCLLYALSKSMRWLPAKEILGLIVRSVLGRNFKFHGLYDGWLYVLSHFVGNGSNRFRCRERRIRSKIKSVTMQIFVHFFGQFQITLHGVVNKKIIPQGLSGISQNRRLVLVKKLDRIGNYAIHFKIARTVKIGASSYTNRQIKRPIVTLANKIGACFGNFVGVNSLQGMDMLFVWQSIVVTIRLIGRGHDDPFDIAVFPCRF